MAQRKNPGNRHPHAPNAAARQAMKGIAAGRDMRKHDPWAITAPVDPTYRGPDEAVFITLRNEDCYDHLLPHGWQDDT